MADTAALMRPISETLRELRKSKGLTQEDVAARAGVSLITVQRAERGDRLSANTIASIAAAFDTTAEALMAASSGPETAPYVDDRDYLPLPSVTSGKQLVDLLSSASAGSGWFFRPRRRTAVPSPFSDRVPPAREARR